MTQVYRRPEGRDAFEPTNEYNVYFNEIVDAGLIERIEGQIRSYAEA